MRRKKSKERKETVLIVKTEGLTKKDMNSLLIVLYFIGVRKINQI